MHPRRASKLESQLTRINYEIEVGDPTIAVDLCRTRIEECSAAQGPDGRDTLAHRGLLGRALTEADRCDEAEQVLRDLVRDRSRISGPTAASTLVARGNLCRAVSRAGRPHEATVLAQILLVDRLMALGPDDPDTLNVRGHLAHSALHLDRCGESLARFKALLADRRRILGRSDWATYTSRVNVRRVRRRIRKLRRPLRQLHREAVRTRLRRGRFDEHTLDLGQCYADRLLDAGQHAVALRTIDEVERARRGTLGPVHPASLVAAATRARAEQAHGRTAEAVAGLEKILEAVEAAGVAGHPAALTCRADVLGLWLGLLADGPDPGAAVRAIRRHHEALVAAGGAGSSDPWVRALAVELVGALDGWAAWVEAGAGKGSGLENRPEGSRSWSSVPQGFFDGSEEEQRAWVRDFLGGLAPAGGVTPRGPAAGEVREADPAPTGRVERVCPTRRSSFVVPPVVPPARDPSVDR